MARAVLTKQRGLWAAILREINKPISPSWQESMIRVLLAFMTDTSFCRAAAQAGAIPTLVDLLKSPADSIADAAALVLARLSRDSNNRAKAQADAGAAPLLAAACSSRQSPPAASALYELISNLMQGRLHLPARQEQQCCSALLAVLKQAPLEDHGSLASRAMAHLCNGPSSSSIKQAICAAGAVPLLAKQLGGSHLDGRYSAAQLLKQLLLTREPGVAQQLVAAGGIEAAVRALREAEYRHYSTACGDVLQCLCMTHPSCACHAADAGAVLPVVQELKAGAGPGEGLQRMYWIGILQALLQPSGGELPGGTSRQRWAQACCRRCWRASAPRT
jgi:hypothetical protein